MAKIRTAQIIEAAKQAYAAPPAIDYSGYVKAASAVNKLIMDKVGLANEQDAKLMDYEKEDFAGINKNILNDANIAYLTNIRAQMAEDSQIMKTSPNWAKNYKQSQKRWNDNLLNLQQLKKDATTFTNFVKNVKKNKEFMSSYQNSLDQSFLMSVLTESNVVNSSVTFTNQGIQVLGADGEMITMEDLPSGTSIKDGADISTTISDSIHNIEVYNSNGTYDANKQAKIKHDLDMFLKSQTSNAVGSAIFDYKYATSDGMVSFIDVLLDKNSSLKAAYEQRIQESLSEEDPIDTNIEKESLRKKLIRELDDFNLQKIKDEFVDWVHSDVFEHAANVAGSTYKKKISSEISKSSSFENLSESQKNIVKATQTFDLEAGVYITKSPIYGLDITGGGYLISGTKLEELLENAGLDSDVFKNEKFEGGETEYRLTSDGVLKKAVHTGEGDDRVAKWKNSKFQKNSKSNTNRDQYNDIVTIINMLEEDANIELAGNYFAETLEGKRLTSSNVYYDTSIKDISKRVYVEKITHTAGSRKNLGAKTNWFHGQGGPVTIFTGKGEVLTIKRMDKWIESMGFGSVKHLNCAETIKGPPAGSKSFYIYNSSCTSNDIKIYAPDGKTYITLNSNHYSKDAAEDDAIKLDDFINAYYLRSTTDAERYTYREIENADKSGQYVGQDKFSTKAY